MAGDEFKTSVRILGEDQVDEFHALCLLRGRRPFQLAADMVLEAIRASRDDPAEHAAVVELVDARRHFRARQENEQAPNVVPLDRWRRRAGH